MSRPEKNHRNYSQEGAGHTEGETAGKWTVLAIVSIGIFMATLDSSIVNISLPKISLDFHVPLSGIVEWVIIAYLVIIVSLLLLRGRLSDMVGHKLLWVTGIGIFTIGSVLCSIAPSLLLLVLFQSLQDVGAAAMMAVSPAMIARSFPQSAGGLSG
jgi:MFS family permease